MRFIVSFLRKMMAGVRERLRVYVGKINRKKKIVPDPLAELLIFAFDIAKTQLGHYIKPFGAQWLRADFNKNAFDNLNFMYKNTVFSVIIDIQNKNGKSFLPDRVRVQQEKMAKKYNFVPCKFAVVVNDPYKLDLSQTRPKSQGLNLLHTLTNEIIVLDDFVDDKKKELSEWELHNFAVKYAVRYLEGNGYDILSFQDNIGIDPQIWIRDKSGNKAWVIVRYEINKEKVNLPKNLNELIRKGFSNNGYFFGGVINTPDKKSYKLYRGDNLSISISGFENIHSAVSLENVRKVSILEENVRDMVLRSVSQDVIYTSKDLAVYPVFNHEELLLKIGTDYLHKLDELSDDLVLVPIRYEGNIRENRNLGLTLYHIAGKNSKYARNGFVLPKDVVTLMRWENFSLIRKINGDNVSSFYLKYFDKVIGAEKIDYKKFPRYSQFKMIMDINSKYGSDAVVTVLSLCEQGINGIEAGLLAEGSPEYNFMDGREFALDYNKFVEKYLETLGKLANLPQSTFDKAVNNILSANGFIFDFVHPRNTFIDFDKQEFNFIDFVYEEKIVKQSRHVNFIRKFRNALLGRHFSMDLHPKNLMFYPKTKELFEYYAKVITDKLNLALPDDEYKLTKNY